MYDKWENYYQSIMFTLKELGTTLLGNSKNNTLFLNAHRN